MALLSHLIYNATQVSAPSFTPDEISYSKYTTKPRQLKPPDRHFENDFTRRLKKKKLIFFTYFILLLLLLLFFFLPFCFARPSASSSLSTRSANCSSNSSTKPRQLRKAKKKRKRKAAHYPKKYYTPFSSHHSVGGEFS